MKGTRIVLVATAGLVFGGCLSLAPEKSNSVTWVEARSLVSTLIGNKAWEIEADSSSPAPPPSDPGYFRFGVLIDPETGERMDFYVDRKTGDIFESPGGPLIQTRAVLENLREGRIPGDFEDSLWWSLPGRDSASTLTLTSQSVTVRDRSLVLTGSVVRYVREGQEIEVEWITLYDATGETTTELGSKGRFRLEENPDPGVAKIRVLDAGTDPSLEFLKNGEWERTVP